MKHTITLVTIVICTISCCAHDAQAALITIEIKGEVRFIDGYDAPSTIHEGDMFTGTYTYSSTTEDTNPSSDIGDYWHDTPYGISLSLGGYEFKTAGNHLGQFLISIGDNHVVHSGNVFDEYEIRSYENSPLSNGVMIDEIRWSLYDNTHIALSSTALPVTAPALSEWSTNALGIYGPGNSLSIQGTVTEAVPEPFTGILMTVGVIWQRRIRGAVTGTARCTAHGLMGLVS